MRASNHNVMIFLFGVLATVVSQTEAFVVPAFFSKPSSSSSLRMAGGFQWTDPSQVADIPQNPYKNPAFVDGAVDESGLKVSPARILAQRLQGVNLYFIGMMGAGKTTVASKLALKMKTYKFADTDDLCEKCANMTIPEIFAKSELRFRRLESQVLDALHCYTRSVVSTGGGIVKEVENWAKLRSGIVVWIDMDPEHIIERIKGTDRPLLQCDDPLQKLTDLLEERRPMYEQADVRVKVTPSMNEDDVIEKVVYDVHHFIDDNPPRWKKDELEAQFEGLEIMFKQNVNPYLSPEDVMGLGN